VKFQTTGGGRPKKKKTVKGRGEQGSNILETIQKRNREKTGEKANWVPGLKKEKK